MTKHFMKRFLTFGKKDTVNSMLVNVCGTDCDNNYLAEIKQSRLKVIHNDIDKNIITVEMKSMEDDDWRE